jgi:hypothetical protein
MTASDALDAAEEFLGAGYKDMGNGRFVSADRMRQVRMGDADISGAHGGGSHINFETFKTDPNRPGRMMQVENIHIYLTD